MYLTLNKMSHFHNPIICALDDGDLEAHKTLCAALRPHIGAVKLGLGFFTHYGWAGVEHIVQQGIPVFLDLKLHDIPNTVAHAMRHIVHHNIDIITVHAGGGLAMMRAAYKAARDEVDKLGKKMPLIVGVTVLTSMDQKALHETGMHLSIEEQVVNLASLAKEAGLGGVICSSHEVAIIKEKMGASFKTIVPGIRPLDSALEDQKRVMTPKQAMIKGADFLVIGRPITKAKDPVVAAAKIAQDISGLKG